MNALFKNLIAGCLIGGISPVFAASTTDLTVKGLITPSSCTPSLSAGGQVDYGKVSAKDLNPTQSTFLSEARLQMTIDCEAPTPMAFKIIDNHPATSSNRWHLGLGLTPAQEKIGILHINFDNPIVDGKPVHVSESEDNGHTWRSNTNKVFYTLSMHAPTEPTDTSTPILTQNFSTDLIIKASIARTDSLTLTEEVAFKGSGTIEVLYL